MNKKKRIGLIIAFVSFLLICVLVVLYYFGATYPYYNSIKKDEFAIPGLDSSFVPQGFEYDEISRTFFVSGYMADGSASRIYILCNDGLAKAKFVTVGEQDQEHKGHMGGIAVYQNFIFVASDGYIYRLDKNNILQAQNQASVDVVDSFKTGNGADSITIFDNKMFVGEFYKEGKYDTNENHHIIIKDGEINKALAYCYTLDLSKPYGVFSIVPEFGLSLPNQVQGFDFTLEGNIVVSTSFSISDSVIMFYEKALSESNKQIITLFEKEFPVYILSSSNLKKEITAPAMSEEVVIKDNRVYLLYESACSKYRFVNRTRTRVVHSIALNNIF